MKKRTRKQKFTDYADAIKCMKEGKPVKRSHAKDGSIPTYSIVPVPNLLESQVLVLCKDWLKKHHIFHDRNNTGILPDASGFHRYGIAGGGDIIGILPNGIHIELEVKRGKGGRLSEGQQKRMRDVRNNNGLYFVVHGQAELEYYMKDLI